MTIDEKTKYIKNAWKKIQDWIFNSTSFADIKQYTIKEYEDSNYFEVLEIYPNKECAIVRGDNVVESLIHKEEGFSFSTRSYTLRWLPQNYSYDDWMNKENDVFTQLRNRVVPKNESSAYYQDYLDKAYINRIEYFIKQWKRIKSLIQKDISFENELKSFEA